MNKITVILITVVTITLASVPCFAQKTAASILREGLLGAGTGAIAGAASGASGQDLWKGALTGAGVNIIGGSILDLISGNNGNSTQRTGSAVYAAPANSYVVPNNNVTYQRVTPQQVYYGDNSNTNSYDEGYAAGFKAGYIQGYKEGIKDGSM